jgi:hypothetical protein
MYSTPRVAIQFMPRDLLGESRWRESTILRMHKFCDRESGDGSQKKSNTIPEGVSLISFSGVNVPDYVP